jgi:hypothetical protein
MDVLVHAKTVIDELLTEPHHASNDLNNAYMIMA